MANRRVSVSLRPGILLLVGTGLLWGTIGIAGRMVFDRTELDPLEVSWLRTMFAAPACFLLGVRMHGRQLFAIQRRDWLLIASLAITIFAFQFLYLFGVQEVGVSVATLICLCSIPVLVSIYSVVVQGERLSRAVLVALIGAVLGTGLLTIGQGGSGGNGALWLGIGASFLSAIGASAYNLGGRAISQRYPPITALALGFPIALVLFAPVMRGGHLNSDIPITAWLLLIYLGVGTQGLAYFLFQWGLQTESATVASIVTLIEPVLAAFLAWLFFAERLGLLGLIGAGMLIAGLIVLTFSTPPSATRSTIDDLHYSG